MKITSIYFNFPKFFLVFHPPPKKPMGFSPMSSKCLEISNQLLQQLPRCDLRPTSQMTIPVIMVKLFQWNISKLEPIIYYCIQLPSALRELIITPFAFAIGLGWQKWSCDRHVIWWITDCAGLPKVLQLVFPSAEECRVHSVIFFYQIWAWLSSCLISLNTTGTSLTDWKNFEVMAM